MGALGRASPPHLNSPPRSDAVHVPQTGRHRRRRRRRCPRRPPPPRRGRSGAGRWAPRWRARSRGACPAPRLRGGEEGISRGGGHFMDGGGGGHRPPLFKAREQPRCLPSSTPVRGWGGASPSFQTFIRGVSLCAWRLLQRACTRLRCARGGCASKGENGQEGPNTSKASYTYVHNATKASSSVHWHPKAAQRSAVQRWVVETLLEGASLARSDRTVRVMCLSAERAHNFSSI